MAIWSTKITRVRLTLSPFTSEQMSTLGSTVLTSITDRIRRAEDVTDNPAKPLTEAYRRQKVKGRRVSSSGNIIYKGQGIRDWKLRGWTLASLKVKRASENRVTIGPINDAADKIIAAQNRRQKQWGFSPKDTELMRQTAIELLRSGGNVKAQKVS